MINKVINIFFISLVSVSYGQEIITKANNIIVENTIYADGTIITYDEELLLKAGTKCTLSSLNAESVFCNFFNIKSKKELLSFFGEQEIPASYSKDKYLKQNSIYFEDSKNNYYKLDSKFVFNKPDKKDIFIKYINYNVNFPKPLYAIFYLQEQNGKFIIKDMGQNLNLALFLISIKSKSLNDFFRNKMNKDQEKILQPYIKNDTKKSINLSLIINDFFKLKKENDKHPLIKLLYDEQYSLF